eukprot:1696458-Alexandrium_andersonii.AAC.1
MGRAGARNERYRQLCESTFAVIRLGPRRSRPSKPASVPGDDTRLVDLPSLPYPAQEPPLPALQALRRREGFLE